MTEHGAARLVAGSFAVSIAGSAIFAATFALGGQPQLEGTGLGIACFGLMTALLVWVKKLVAPEQVEDHQHPQRSPIPERAAAEREFEMGAFEVVSRRQGLVRWGLAAGSSLAVAALFPLRSFGPSPEGRIGLTDWKPGLRLVGVDGKPIRVSDLPLGAFTTAFPEGFVGPDHIENMTQDPIMLIHVNPNALLLPRERSGWAPQGFIAYSKVCTHAGCPVALYRQGPEQLMCPCHQSTFDVVRGGDVVFGPAARGLPQLPIVLADDGTLKAGGDMSGVVGPAAWNFP